MVWVDVAAIPALAHPKVDEAKARLEAAEFETALRLLAEAEASADLSREDALRLLELRALVHLALKDEAGADAALQALAVLAPDHTFARHTSPDLIAAFARAREHAPARPELVLARELRPEGVRLSARVEGDTLGLLRSVRLWTRIDKQPWRETPAPEALVAAAGGQRLEYRAEAQGVGGATLLQSETFVFVVPRERATTAAADANSGTSPWLYAGLVGGMLAVAGTVTALVLINGESETTRLTPPSVVDR